MKSSILLRQMLLLHSIAFFLNFAYSGVERMYIYHMHGVSSFGSHSGPSLDYLVLFFSS